MDLTEVDVWQHVCLFETVIEERMLNTIESPSAKLEEGMAYVWRRFDFWRKPNLSLKSGDGLVEHRLP